jgi:flagellar biosynthesis/type III secretory pathway protein FliH
MSDPQLSPENVANLIDHVLKAKDPATVGLRKILKHKQDVGQGFPLRELALEEMHGAEEGGTVLSEDEQQILRLEKRVNELQAEVTQQKKRAANAIQQAYQKGIEEGRARGCSDGRQRSREEYEQRLLEVKKRLAEYASGIEASRRQLFAESHTMLVDLSLQIAHKIVQCEIQMNPQVVLSVVKHAMSYIAERERLIVRVAPGDIEMVSGQKDFWSGVIDRLDTITIESDERIGRGGCIVESNAGVADARIEVMMREVEETVEKCWGDVLREVATQPPEEIPEFLVSESIHDQPPNVSGPLGTEPSGGSEDENHGEPHE